MSISVFNFTKIKMLLIINKVVNELNLDNLGV